MRIGIFKEGCIVIKEGNNAWLFSVPKGTKEALEKVGVEIPNTVFTSCLKSPGYGDLGKEVVRFKEEPHRLEDIQAEPIKHKHGTDYKITTKDATVLFSERGDVSAEDVKDYDLCIIKNKHRSDEFGDNIITWPWEDSEFIVKEHEVKPVMSEVRVKVWSSVEDVPDNLKKIDGIALTLEQANLVARIAQASGEGDKENWAIAISTFQKGHEKKGDRWVKKETKEKEEIVDSDGRVASDYLEVEDPEKVTTWHLAVSNKGKIDPKLMGGAAAALTVGHRGNVYEGPNKDKLIKKLVALYNKEEMEPPENLQTAYERLKEYEDGKPVPRIVDILTANLHKAYNDTSDWLFKQGYLNQDERMEIATSIGAGLAEFRSKIDKTGFATRAVEKYDLEPPCYKEFVTVYKDSKGIDRWASISSMAIQDKQGETFTPKAMDWAMGFSKVMDYKGPLRYKHVPGLDGGDCDTQFRVGDFFFESGTFRDTPLGRKMKEILSSEEPWQISLGLAFAKEDLVDGVYQRAAIFERSMTQKPALPFTSLISVNKEETEMKILTEEELTQVADELNLELTEVKTMYERAVGAGTPFATKEALQESLKQEKEEEETEAYTEEQMKEIIANLSDEEFKGLEAMMDEVREKKSPSKNETKRESQLNMEYEEEDVDEKAKKAQTKVKEEEDELKAVLIQQVKLLETQTKAIEALAGAVTNRGSTEDLQNAVAKVLAKVPKAQAGQFVTTQTKEEEDSGLSQVDEAVMNKLKEIENLAKQSGGKDIYGMFTSKRLNG